MQTSLWLVSHDGRPIRLFSRRSFAADCVVRAVSLRLLEPPSGLYRSSLLQVGAVSTPCGVWRIESVPVDDFIVED